MSLSLYDKERLKNKLLDKGYKLVSTGPSSIYIEDILSPTGWKRLSYTSNKIKPYHILLYQINQLTESDQHIRYRKLKTLLDATELHKVRNRGINAIIRLWTYIRWRYDLCRNQKKTNKGRLYIKTKW